MNVAGIRVDNQNVFESLSYSIDEEKTTAENAIKNDALESSLDIRIEYMDDDVLQAYIKEHSVD